MIVVAMMFATPFAEICAQNNTFPWPVAAYIGIGTNNPQKKLNVHAAPSIIYPNGGDPTIRLSYGASGNAEGFLYAGHLSLLTPDNTIMYGGCYDYSLIRPIIGGGYTLPVQNATNGDLILQAGEPPIAAGGYGDLILTTRSSTGFLRFATTEPASGANIERFTMTPEGKIGINTSQPAGMFDINLRGWNCNMPKITLSSAVNVSKTSSTSDPSLRLYRASGSDLDCPNVSSWAWWLENGAYHDIPGVSSLRFRAGVSTENSSDYTNRIGTEKPVTRMKILSNGDVGINQEWPSAKLHVTDGALLFEGASGSTPKRWKDLNNDPDNTDWQFDEIGAGTRLMWIPEKAAFRAGIVGTASDGNHDPEPNFDKTKSWDDAYIGFNSFAFGYSSRASGSYDIALGFNNLSNSGDKHGAVAIGHANRASGEDAFAMGYSNRAYGQCAQIFGRECNAFAKNAMAIGAFNSSKKATSYTFGYGCTANAENSMCMGIGPLENNNENSILMGVNDAWGAYISYANASYHGQASRPVPRVGIGTLYPENTLGVNGNVVIGWSGSQALDDPHPNASKISLVAEKNVGIGTYSPHEALSVTSRSSTDQITDDNRVIIWNNPTGPIADPSIDLMVEEKVVIGRNSLLDPSETYTTRPQDLLLHVNGRAIKSDGTDTWVIASDERYKKDIAPFRDGLDKIRMINPIWFKYNGEFGFESFDKQVGILAQEMQRILPYTINEDTLSRTIITKHEKRYEVDAVDTVVVQVKDATKREGIGHFGTKDSIVLRPVKRMMTEPAESRLESAAILTYNSNALKYVLVNAIKEIDAAITAQKKEASAAIDILQQTIDSLHFVAKKLEQRVARLESQQQMPLDEAIDVLLEQNTPNPFAGNSTITYFIPEKVQGNAEIVVATSNQSSVIKRFDCIKGIPSQVVISAQDMTIGIYVYSVLANGKVLASKKMILIR